MSGGPDGDGAASDGSEPGAARPVQPHRAAERSGADRFMWWIHARWGDEDEREAELPDDEITGAWRELVDAVREWSSAARESR